MNELHPKAVAMFVERVQPRSFDECWPWTHATTKGGYGTLTFWLPGERRSTSVTAHRVAYSLLKGPIPAGLHIDHVVCQNRSCQNVLHLEAVTQQVNNARIQQRRGPDHHLWRPECFRGHDLTVGSENVYVAPSGARYCRQCHRISQGLTPMPLPRAVTDDQALAAMALRATGMRWVDIAPVVGVQRPGTLTYYLRRHAARLEQAAA